MPDSGDFLPPPCPACGGHLRVEYRLRAKPIGTFSLAGAQPKVVAENWPWVVCDGCGIEAEAEVSGRSRADDMPR